MSWHFLYQKSEHRAMRKQKEPGLSACPQTDANGGGLWGPRGPTGERERDAAQLSTRLWSRQAVGRWDVAETWAEPLTWVEFPAGHENGPRVGRRAAHSPGPGPKRDLSSLPGRSRPCHATGRRALLGGGRRVILPQGTGSQQPKTLLEASRSLALSPMWAQEGLSWRTSSLVLTWYDHTPKSLEAALTKRHTDREKQSSLPQRLEVGNE